VSNIQIFTGVDIIEIERVRTVLERFNHVFLGKLFVHEELEFYRKRGTRRFLEGISALFASKEAIKKLFLRRGMHPRWKDILILHAPSGEPVVQFAYPFDHCFQSVSLSFSHSDRHVVAVAIGWVVDHD